jgi:hypothetical protein
VDDDISWIEAALSRSERSDDHLIATGRKAARGASGIGVHRVLDVMEDKLLVAVKIADHYLNGNIVVSDDISVGFGCFIV